MSANRSCTACRNLQEKAPDFVMNGVTETVDASLRNNTGLNPSSGNDDCTDLNDAADCLIGNMEDAVDAYAVCDWKPFMVDFIHNLWSVLKAIISAICGLWTRTEKNTCEIGTLFNGQTFYFGEDTEGESKLVPGQGVDFSLRGSDAHSSDVQLQYIAGGLLRVSGSLTTFIRPFYDKNGVQKSGNLQWRFAVDQVDDRIKEINGGELLYEIRIKKSEYPQIKNIFNGHLCETNGVRYSCRFVVFHEGKYAYGQHGWCDTSTGAPSGSTYDSGHLVPNGWIYCQVRMLNQDGLSVYGIEDGNGNTVEGSKFTPSGYTGIRFNRDGIDCSSDDDGDDPDPDLDPDPDPETYAITASITPFNGGMISGVGTYAAGSNVTLTATPADGYRLSSWTVDGVTVSQSTYTVSNIQSDVAVVATFEIDPERVIEAPDNAYDSTAVYVDGDRYVTKSFTITNTPVTGTTVKVTIEHYSSGISESLEFTAGTSATLTPTKSVFSNVTVQYDGEKQVTLAASAVLDSKVYLYEVEYYR